MAVRTSTQAGNTNSAPYAFGSAVAVGDQLIVASGHAVTLDASIALGTSPPQSPTTLLTVSLSTGGTVTSLSSGTYIARYSFVDANGHESTPGAAVGTGSVVNGTSKPRVTLPWPVAGVSSINLYLSAAGGAAGSETLYASGIAATTYDLVSGSWANGTTTQAAAAAWSSQAAVYVKAGGSLTGSNGSTLTCRGDAILGNTAGSSTLQGWAGGGITFDPSGAASPANAGYVLWFGDANNFASNRGQFVTSGTSAASPFTIKTLAGPYKAARVTHGITGFGTFADACSVNASYVNLTRMGDSLIDSFQFIGNGTVATLTGWIFDTCGRLNWVSIAPATSGWNITGCTWKNTPAGVNCLNTAASATLTTGTRTISGNVFDRQVALSVPGQTITNNVFSIALITGGGGTDVWAAFDGNLVFSDFATGSNPGGFPTGGDVTNNIVIGDTSPAASATGTATAATATTLTDSTKSWTTNQFQAGVAGLTVGWGVVIRSGTGAGQARIVASNTATTLTVSRAWDTNPDATSTYAVYGACANPHFLAATPGAGLTVNLTGNVFQFVGTDNNGDCFLHLDSGTSGSHTVYNLRNNVILPNVARDNSGTLVTIGADPNGEFHILHNTYFTGAQCLSVNEGVPTGMAGVVKEFKSNLAWADPAQSYDIAAGLGPFKLVDSSHLPIATGGGTADIVLNSAGVSQADYNAGYGLLSGYADQNFAGSGRGYQVKTTVAMGSHDVDGQDPAFVDRWRGVWDFAATLGAAGDPFQRTAALRAKFLALNVASDPNHDAGATIPALRSYLLAGQVPQSPALAAAGHDVTTIGAMAAQVSAVTVVARRNRSARTGSRGVT